MSITARLVSTRSVSILELNHTTSHWFVARGLKRVFPQKKNPQKTPLRIVAVSLQDSSRIQRVFPKKTPLHIVAGITAGFQQDFYQGMKGYKVHVNPREPTPVVMISEILPKNQRVQRIFGDPRRSFHRRGSSTRGTRQSGGRGRHLAPPRAEPGAGRAVAPVPLRHHAEPGAGSRADRRARRLARQ
jgi:hypothetical protein